MTEKIDRYGSLMQETEILRQEIIREMKAQGFTRHFGTQYQASILKAEKTIFEDKEKVIVLLKKYKLLDKTRVPTQRTIAALLTAPAVPEAVKKELSALAKTTRQENLQLEKTE